MTLFGSFIGLFLVTFLVAITLPNIKKQISTNNQGKIQRIIVVCRVASIVLLLAALITYLNLN